MEKNYSLTMKVVLPAAKQIPTDCGSVSRFETAKSFRHFSLNQDSRGMVVSCTEACFLRYWTSPWAGRQS